MEPTFDDGAMSGAAEEDWPWFPLPVGAEASPGESPSPFLEAASSPSPSPSPSWSWAAARHQGTSSAGECLSGDNVGYSCGCDTALVDGGSHLLEGQRRC